MTRFITPGPTRAFRRCGSSLDPVLSGVAQGLARLFPVTEPPGARGTRGAGSPAPEGPQGNEARERTGDPPDGTGRPAGRHREAGPRGAGSAKA